MPDETVLYFYSQKEVDQITLPNKINVRVSLYRFIGSKITKFNSISKMDRCRFDTPMALTKLSDLHYVFICFFNKFFILFKQLKLYIGIYYWESL